MDNVIEVRDLSRRFGETQALDGVTFDIQPGLVYGVVGGNGQGKTTLIKHLLGLLRAKQGAVRVFGMDPVKQPAKVLERIGYLSEERDLPEWMRVDELLRYTSAFHPGWDAEYANELLDMFRLDGKKKVKDLSKGMRAQAGLIVAVAHRPELLLLDEPSTGLDAVVRKDILNEIIRAVADDGRTAIFSSHLLDEVELMSDHVLMIDQGQLVMQGALDEIKSRHTLLNVRYGDTSDVRSQRDSLHRIDEILACEKFSGSWNLICTGAKDHVRQAVEWSGGEVTLSRNASLQEIFVARVGRDKLDVVGQLNE